jgi:cAMP-dependent protein kinase regulator
VCGPGDYFGEMALLKDEPRAANAIAKGNVQLAALSKECFTRLLGSATDLLSAGMSSYEKVM